MNFTLNEVIQAELSLSKPPSLNVYLKPNPTLRPIQAITHTVETPVPDSEVDHNNIPQMTVVDDTHEFYQTIVEQFNINLGS
jgi:hypothetical protein